MSGNKCSAHLTSGPVHNCCVGCKSEVRVASATSRLVGVCPAGTTLLPILWSGPIDNLDRILRGQARPRTCHKLSVRCWKTVKFVAWHACIAGCIVQGLARFGCNIRLPRVNTLASKPSSARAPHERAGGCSRVPEPGLQEGAPPNSRYLSHVLRSAAPMRR